MKAILIDLLNFEKEIEVSDDARVIEIPTVIDIPGYTFIKPLFIISVPYFIFEREGDTNIFRMKPTEPIKPVYWIGEEDE